MAYTAGSSLPRDRLRAAVRDTGSDTLFTDDEYDAWLDRSQSGEFVALYYPEGNTVGVTSATARVVESGTDVVLELQRVPLDGSADSVALSATDEDTVGDLVDRIRALDKGWEVGLATRRQDRVTWLDVDQAGWRAASLRPMLRSIVDRARCRDLAVHRHGALSALGNQVDTYARLHFFLYASALQAALMALDGRNGEEGLYRSRRKGNSAWVRGGADGGLSPRLTSIRGQVAFGIYQQAVL